MVPAYRVPIACSSIDLENSGIFQVGHVVGFRFLVWGTNLITCVSAFIPGVSSILVLCSGQERTRAGQRSEQEAKIQGIRI
jgi:hypothetical protein